MTPDCEPLHRFADGELEAAEADAFRLHLAGCAACQAGLEDILQLDALGEALGKAGPGARRSPAAQGARPSAAAGQGAPVLDLAAAREKRRRWIPLLGGAAAAAAALLLVVRAPRETDLYGLGATRPLEARLTHPGASEYRPYDVVRAAGAAPVPVPLTALAKLEEKGDLRGLAEGHLLRGERAQASAALDRAQASPETQSDRAVAALQGGQADEALLLLEPVLAANPQHAQALWNRGLALRELGLPLSAAEAFEAAAALREPGWAEEAGARAASLRAAAKQAEGDWQEARRAGLALALQGTLPTPEAVRAHPGLFRLYLYDAVRAAPDAARVRSLRPVADELDRAAGGRVLAALLDRVAGADFTRRAPLAAEYAKLVRGEPDPDAATLFARARGEADLQLGALWMTKAIPAQLEAYRALAQGDPWFEAIAAQEAAEGLARSRPLEAAAALARAVRAATEAHVDYRAVNLGLRLAELDLGLHQVSDSWTQALAAHRLARARGEWQQEQSALYQLASSARFRTAFALSRAALHEALLRTPGDCRTQAFVHETLADLLLFQVRGDEARRELDRIPACGDAPTLHGAMLLADLARLAPAAGDAARLQQELSTLRAGGALSAGEAALALHIEGRLLIESDRAAGTALLEKAIAAADALPREDTAAQKARGYSYSTLILDAGRRSEAKQALRLFAAEAGAAPPERCAVGVAVADERSLLALLGSTGAPLFSFEGTRRGPLEAFAPQLTAEQLQALRECPTLDVFARPPLHGRASLLPAELAWSYRGRRSEAEAKGPSAARPRSLVVADIEPPTGLGLPRLAPWETSAQPGRTELRGAAATPSRVLEEMAFATEIEIHAHGLVDLAQSDASMIVLSPSGSGAFALTAGAVRATRLAGAPLVLLAACSAAAPGTALHAPWSLPEAFLAAGARAVLASAGEIPDAQARQFFDAVRARIQHGQAPAAALRDERVAFRGRPGSAWVDGVLLFN